MKKFMLINSPISWDYKGENEQYLSPLGLGYIATCLENINDLAVEIVDCVKEGIRVKDVISRINKEKPSFVGVNVFSQNMKMVQYIIEHIDIECKCFVGGQVVKSVYKEILKWKTSNIVNIIIGEGEFIIPQIVLEKCSQTPEEQLESKVVYRVNSDSVYFPRDISNIFLNRKYLHNEMLINHYGQKEIAIITSRGCMYNCAFCGGAKNLNEDVTVRIRTEDSVRKEIQTIISEYPDVQSIRILDDLFLRSGKSIDMANNIFSGFPQLNWRGMAHVLSLGKSLDRVKDLRIGGCRELFVGIESGSETVRRRIKKMGHCEDVVKVSQEILKNGIDLKGYFIYGFPGETKEDFQKTFELAERLKDISLKEAGTFRTSVFQFRPYHGTQLYNEIVSNVGKIQNCHFNDSISQFEGRAQFNFDFGNYSKESQDLLNKYIIKTQQITGEE